MNIKLEKKLKGSRYECEKNIVIVYREVNERKGTEYHGEEDWERIEGESDVAIEVVSGRQEEEDHTRRKLVRGGPAEAEE